MATTWLIAATPPTSPTIPAAADDGPLRLFRARAARPRAAVGAQDDSSGRLHGAGVSLRSDAERGISVVSTNTKNPAKNPSPGDTPGRTQRIGCKVVGCYT